MQLKPPLRTIFPLICVCLGLLAQPERSAADDDCIKCHGKGDLSVESPGGVKTSLYVDETVLRAGAHGGLGCVECHGEGFRQVPHSGDRGPVDCGRCHEDQQSALAGSVHGQGREPAAGCADCHGAHDVLPISRPESPANPDRVAGTCGGCHRDILAEYEGSVHGVAGRQGVTDAPTCTGCHGVHSILSSDNPTSTVFAGNVPAACSKCHDEERITREYGLATRRLETYENSFHGIANRFGEAVVANCASCHGIHKILPSGDPASSIAPGNLAATCGKCHIGAGENFARGAVHVEATRESSKGMFYVRRFYTWLIGILLGLFILHIAMDVAGYRRRKRLDAGSRQGRTR